MPKCIEVPIPNADPTQHKKEEGYLENSLEDAITCRQSKMEENTS